MDRNKRIDDIPAKIGAGQKEKTQRGSKPISPPWFRIPKRYFQGKFIPRHKKKSKGGEY